MTTNQLQPPKPVVAPDLPPPVQPPELYPGYTKDIQGLGLQLSQAEKQLQSAQAKIPTMVKIPGVPVTLQIPAEPLIPKLFGVEPESVKAKQEVDISIQQIKNIRWRQRVLQLLPGYMQSPNYTTDKLEDIQQLIPNDTAQPADIEWLGRVFNKLIPLRNTLPEGFTGDVLEAQKKLLEQVLVKPPVQMANVNKLTVDELLKTFQPRIGALPQGMTTEQARELLARIELAIEETKQLDGWLLEKSAEWATEADKLNLLRAGLTNPSPIEPTPGEFLKLLAVQPMMAGVVALDKYFDILPRPAVVAANIAVHRLFKTPEDTWAAKMEEYYNTHRASGESPWQAYTSTFRDISEDMPWWMSMLLEGGFDPTSFIGMGVAGSMATKLGSGLTKVGLKSIGTRVGPTVWALENGYTAGADVVFKAGLNTINVGLEAALRGGVFTTTGLSIEGVPRTLTQMSRNFARGGLLSFKAVLERKYPHVKNLQGLTSKDISDTVSEAVEAARTRPTEGNDIQVRAGASLQEFTYLDTDTVRQMVGDAAKDVEIFSPNLAHLNEQVALSFSGQGDRVTAGNMLAELFADSGMSNEAYEQAVSRLASKLSAFKDTVAKDVGKVVSTGSPNDAIWRLFEHLQTTRYNNLTNPITQYMTQAGRTASWTSRMADTILYNAKLVGFERRFVMPFAKWNLLFVTFGPFNFGENAMRAFLGGGELLAPPGYLTSEFTTASKGLAGVPYETIMFEQAEAKESADMIKLNAGQLFEGGKIPFITRDVTLPGWFPKLQIPELPLVGKLQIAGGKPIGRTINIGGKNVFIGSMQDDYNAWGKINRIQIVRDYDVHFNKALAELAPDEMNSIYGVLESHRAELNNIQSIIDTKDIEGVERNLRSKIIGVGPDAVRAEQNVDVFTMERRKLLKDLRSTVDKADQVSAVTKARLEDSVLDGSLFQKGIDNWYDTALAEERSLGIASLVEQTDRLHVIADLYLANPPKTLPDFLWDMENITGAYLEGTFERITNYRETQAVRAKLIKDVRARDRFQVGSAKILADYLKTANTELGKVLNTLATNARTIGLTDNQATRLADVVAIQRARLERVLDVRTRNLSIDAKYSTTPRADKTDRFYAEQDAAKSASWDEYRDGKAGSVGENTLKRSSMTAYMNFLQSVNNPVFIPEFIPEVTAGLTPSHVAYLFGSTGDDAYRGLTKVVGNATVLMPKADFTNYVAVRANAYAAKLNKTAAEIGFSDEAIGDVYDQMWRNLGLDANKIVEDSPLQMQLEEIRQELARLQATNKIPGAVDLSKVKFVDISSADIVKVSKLIDALPFRIKANLKSISINEPRVLAKDLDALALYSANTGEIVFRSSEEIVPDTLYHEIGHSTMEQFRIEQNLDFATDWLRIAPVREAGIESPFETLRRTNVKEEFADNFVDYITKPRDELIKLDANRLEFFEKYFPKGDSPDIVKWRKYINSVADDVEKLPMYQPITVGKPLVVPPATADVIKAAESLPFDQESRIQILANLEQNLIVAQQRGEMDIAADLITKIEQVRTRPVTAGQAPKGMSADDIDMLTRELLPAYYDAVAGGDKEAAEAFVRLIAARLSKGVVPPVTPTARSAGLSGTADWWSKKESAITKAREMHQLAFPTYDDANILEEGGRALMPFLNYELFRWRWLPRTFLRTPGTLTALARWDNYSDQGYIPQSFLGMQLNPLRGSIWMGGLRSTLLRDFPEYYDAFPGAEFIDYIGRLGFYPGIHVMAPIVLAGAHEGKPEWGQLAPAWVQSGLSALRAISPEGIGKLLDIYYPDRFRDYQTMLELGRMGYDADELWQKKKQGLKLLPAEEKLWLTAENKANGVKGILMQQTGLLRIRPEEKSQVITAFRQAIQEATGVPIQTQIEIDRLYPTTGKRLSDYYRLDILQSKLLYTWEQWRQWQGVSASLMPSGWQQLDIKISQYYDELAKLTTDARHTGVYEDGKLVQPSMIELNRQLVSKIIGPDQWLSGRDNLQTGIAAGSRALGNSAVYKDVPKTLEEREALYRDRGIPTPTYGPDQELLWYYYELKPELAYDWDAGRMQNDYETYFAKIDMLLGSLSSTQRERFLQRTQIDWTPIEQLYWQTSREYLRPYRSMRNIVLETYTDIEKQQIRRFEVARGDERTELQKVLDAKGDKLISGYQSKLRDARDSLRQIDSTLDAWLYFWGKTDTLLTTAAKEQYDSLAKQYLTERMIE